MLDKKQMAELAIKKLSYAFSEIPFNKMLGLQLDAIQTDYVCLSFNMREELIGNFFKRILHGGVISSVLDMAGGMVAMASVLHAHADKSLDELAEIAGKTSTIDLHISYLRPGLGQTFTAKAWLLKSGSRICFTRMEISNQEGTLLATGTGSYLFK
jgi:uncharacterized protein (TIGR00369 family)